MMNDGSVMYLMELDQKYEKKTKIHGVGKEEWEKEEQPSWSNDYHHQKEKYQVQN